MGELKWGVFDRRSLMGGAVHIAPCSDAGDLAIGHRFHKCGCFPSMERFGNIILVIHQGDH